MPKTWISGTISITSSLIYRTYTSILTASSCLQNMYDGGSGLSVIMQERFIVLPSLRWMSGPPKIAVLGSARKTNMNFSFLMHYRLDSTYIGRYLHSWLMQHQYKDFKIPTIQIHKACKLRCKLRTYFNNRNMPQAHRQKSHCSIF